MQASSGDVDATRCDTNLESVQLSQLTDPTNEVEEALAAMSFIRDGRYQRQRGRGRGRFRGGGQRDSYSRGGRRDSGSQRFKMEKPINREGQDGETLLCKSCGSYRHLLPDCPHSYENMQK